MAGSRSWFEYTDDNDVVYAIEQDSGNGAAVGNTALATPGLPTLPKRLKPRSLELAWVNAGTTGQGTGITRRRIAVGSAAAYAAFNVGATVSLPEYQAQPGVGQTTPNVMRDMTIMRKIPEQVRRAPNMLNTNMVQG